MDKFYCTQHVRFDAIAPIPTLRGLFVSLGWRAGFYGGARVGTFGWDGMMKVSPLTVYRLLW